MTQDPIAIVGMSCLFPGSSDLTGFWRDIVEGRDRLTRVPADRWLAEDFYDADPKAPDKIYVDRGGFLDPIAFDPMKWGLPPSIAPATDSTQLLALVVAERVLRDAFGESMDFPRDATSVILGVTSAQKLLGEMNGRLQRPIWVKALREMGLPESEVQEACARITSHYVPWQESTFPGVLGNVVAGRVANRLDLGGTNCVLDAACASTISALKMGVDELLLGHSDVVVAGGADTMNDPFMFECFAKTTALSPSGDCRPFSDQADGTMLGEGVGMLVLMRQADAEARGVPIYALIRGVGSSSDGRSKSVYAPVPEGQANAIRRAYDRAGFSPRSVELIEAHGTGTAAGDAAELEGLTQVFGEAGSGAARWCGVGSVKAQIGHTKAAAGSAGLIKAVLALRHGVIPPTIKVERPSSALDLDGGPFYLSTEARPWIRGGDHPRRVGVSAFGFGGSNFHVAVEEYTGPSKAPLLGVEGPHLVTLHALESAGLLTAIDAAAQSESLRWLAWDSQREFDASSALRLAIVASDLEDLRAKLDLARPFVSKGEAFSAPGGIELAVERLEGSLAALFPGQGSQYLGMGAALAQRFGRARAVWDRAAPLHETAFPPPTFDEARRAREDDALRATENAQPALGAASAAAWSLLDAMGVAPACFAGHSFGEVSALFAAGAFDEASLLRIARRRGELMRDAAGEIEGAMLAMSAPVDDVRAFVDRHSLDVTLANHNHPTQVVLSGTREAIDAAQIVAKQDKLRASRLSVATAFHSPLVAGSAEPFEAFLREQAIGSPASPVYANATAAPYGDDIAATLGHAIAEPVRFVDQIEAMYDAGVRTFVEVGAGAVLSGLVGRILKGRPHRAIPLDRKGARDTSAFLVGVGRLAVSGVAIDFAPLWENERPPIDPRTLVSPRVSIAVGGANVGKPYPPPGGAAALPPPNPERVAPAHAAPAPSSELEMNHDEPPRGVPADVLQVFLETQRQTAEAHAAYQKATAEAHAEFLRNTAATMNALAALSGSSLPAQPAAPLPLPLPLPLPGSPFATAPAPAPEPEPAPAPAPTPTPALDLTALMLEVVAEKTGYPADMLDPSMELEADLGVDSIKRVEILAKLRERAPHLPELDPAALGKLRTLQEIADVLDCSSPAASSAPTPVAAPPLDLTALMLEVVAEKTGYPAEMLDPSMELEADLGVDSIKRVEILAKLRERAPHLPELDPAALGKLRTLEEITALLRNGSAVSAHVAPVSSAAPSSSSEQSSPMHSASLTRMVVGLREARAPGLAPPGLFGREITVVDAGSGLGELVASALRDRAIDATVGERGDALVHLGALTGDPTSAFEAAVAFGGQGLFVAVFDSDGKLGLGAHQPRAAAVLGLAKTAALEWTESTVRAIDVATEGVEPATTAARIAAEIVSGGAVVEVGIDASGVRRLPIVRAASISRSEESASAPVVVASGGARGVTAVCLLALAKEAGGKYLLLGRSALEDEPDALEGVADEGIETALIHDAKARGETPTPRELRDRARRLRASREVRGTLRAFADLGAEARYAAVDIRDGVALGEALRDARESFGSFTMLVHGAGVLADKKLSDKTRDDFDRVFSTKVDGADALLAALAGDDLETIVLFSSVAARYGNPGQSDYAMANAALDAIAAEQAQKRSARVRSLAWGPWRGGMVTPSLEQHFASLGVPLIDLDEGARAFVDEVLGEDDGAVSVVLGAPLARHSDEESRFEVRISRDSHPYLVDHAVKDVPVMPVVLVLDFFARAAHAMRPDLAVARCRELKVLRGIPLDHFDDGEPFTVAMKLLSNGHGATFAAELRSARGVHYRAQVDAVVELPSGATPRPAPAGLSERAGPLYGGCLFHGERFQVIRGLEGVGVGGAAGTLVGMPSVGWPGDGWQMDPALLDGGLQLAVLWTERCLGGSALPTGLEALHVFHPGPVEGEVRALVHGHDAASGRAVCDVTFVGPSGRPIAELRGVETHVRPGTTPDTSVLSP